MEYQMLRHIYYQLHNFSMLLLRLPASAELSLQSPLNPFLVFSLAANVSWE